MQLRLWIVTLITLLAMPRPARPSSPPQACSGCLGSGGLAIASGGTCGGRLEISVSAGSGECKWFYTSDPLFMECRKVRGCETTIMRSWSGLPTGSVVEFCVEFQGERMCLAKKQIVGASGAGSSTRTGPVLECADGPSTSFLIESEPCGLSASVTPTCSRCFGDI